ncbi:MAG: tRNA (adenosine(37)-N6)-threonylcarbamoyltransferase complex ATPase subunit type 1 TsaE [Candidatus Competibacteraceae bacterium]|nr:tRNA (adenosine(37)-N6)-threonylcarbamoyltransferase complex ATPase subunit type 1 TsaE [Candidatus Competibacteraceae bacterium]
MMTLQLGSVKDTEALGATLAAAVERAGLPGPLVVGLRGELGTGKTTLVRGLLRALGQRGRVKSPTYTLLEPYDLGQRRVYHLDLYRVADPDELEYLGLRELLEPGALLLVEWPQRGTGVLPGADLELELLHRGEGREVRLEASGVEGKILLESLQCLQNDATAADGG